MKQQNRGIIAIFEHMVGSDAVTHEGESAMWVCGCEWIVQGIALVGAYLQHISCVVCADECEM